MILQQDIFTLGLTRSGSTRARKRKGLDRKERARLEGGDRRIRYEGEGAMDGEEVVGEGGSTARCI